MKLYITYTLEDLQDYAYEVGRVAEAQGWEVMYGPKLGFEPTRLGKLPECDALVALSAYIYGAPERGGAIQEQEWDLARKLGKSTGALLVDTQFGHWQTNKIESSFYPDRLKSLLSFQKKLIDGGNVTYFNDDIASVSEEHTSELQSQFHLVCRLLLEKKKKQVIKYHLYIQTYHRLSYTHRNHFNILNLLLVNVF